MGMLVEGRWTDVGKAIQNGRYIRAKSVYASQLDDDVIAGLRARPGRYWLIASQSCPWSHRTLIVRALKGLETSVPLQIAGDPRREGYAVNGGKRWPVPGDAANIRYLHELYSLADAGYTGRATVPLLWDSETCRIVSNESSEIMRAFDGVGVAGGNTFTLRPPTLRASIASLNAHLYENLFNAAYRAGFARRQAIYDEEVEKVFGILEELEQRLKSCRYLFGTTITDTDWRLFAMLVRFDSVYHIHFKCSRRRLIDYPDLWAYARDLYSWHDIADTVNFAAIRSGYYGDDPEINPSGIVATAPTADWSAPHDRERLGGARLSLIDGGDIEIDTATLKPVTGRAS